MLPEKTDPIPVVPEWPEFIRGCKENVLGSRCPNCGGELVARPRRPADRLAKNPPSTERVYRPQGCAKLA